MASSDPEPDVVKVSYPSEGVTVITLDRAHRRNAVDASTARKLYAAILDFEADSSAKIGILYGANGTFCAGYDLHSVKSAGPGTASSVDPPKPEERTQGPMGPSRLQIRKPFLAAVSGHAVAGGLELSLLADMRIVEDSATFGVFCRRWGVPLIDGGTVRLPKIIGIGRAMDMILTGRPVGAQEALQMGLANRVVPNGKAMEKTIELAKELLRFPEVCMNADRRSAYFGMYDAKDFEEALRYEYEGGMEALKQEGVKGAGRFSNGAGRGGRFEKL